MNNPSECRRSTPVGWIRILLAATVACVVFAVMQGVHDNYGIMLRPLVERTGNSYAKVSFIIGVGAFLYGLLPAFFGMIAMRKSHALVMLCGVLMMAAGLAITPFCKPFPVLLAVFGILLPAGTVALGFAIIMGAVTPIMGEKRAAAFSGILQASAGVGDALMAPALQGLISTGGIAFAMGCFSVLILLTFPAVIWLGRCRKSARTQEPTYTIPHADKLSVWSIFREAFKHPSYRKILIGFGTCGFNMSIIESHLFSQFVAGGIAETYASLVMTVYGIFTMLGAMLAGFLGLKMKMKNVLGSAYALRVFISLAFLLSGSIIPLPFALAATALLGLCGDATVPPTSGIITREFGSELMPILYGVALLGHQIGAFASASLGGAFVSAGWGYAPLWVINLILAAVAATASYAIREEKVSAS